MRVQIPSSPLMSTLAARSSSGRMRDPHSRGVGSIPARVTESTAKWWNWDTRHSQKVVPLGHASSTLALATDNAVNISTQCRCGRCPTDFHTVCHPVRYRDLQLRSRVGQCSFGPHKPELPGATPGPATLSSAEYAKRAKRSATKRLPCRPVPGVG